MSNLQAAGLGFVQGFTEFLPISSTAHLRIAPALFGLSDPGAAFTAIVQLGTVLASIVYFANDIIRILIRPAGSDEKGVDRRLLAPIALGTLPIVVCGLAFKNYIEHELRSLYIIAVTMIVFAVVLAGAEVWHKARKEIGNITALDGFIVGVGQAFSLIPGASRSGTTISTALWIGLERATAARFSFLMSLPSVLAAGVYELYKTRHALAATNMTEPLIIATVVSFAVGLASIHWLLSFLRTHPTYWFVGYRIVAGVVILSLLASGALKP